MARSDPKTFNFKAIIIAFVALIFFLAVSFGFHILENKTQSRVKHTLEVKSEIRLVLSLLKDAETGQRGFLITQKDEYLTPYHNALEQVPKALAYLTEITTYDDRHQQSLAKIKTLSQQKFNELGETIALIREGRIKESYALVDTDLGKQLMNQMRLEMREMEDLADKLLDQLSYISFLIEAISILLFLIALFYVKMSYRLAAKLKQSTSIIEASEAKFRAMYENSPDAYLIMELEHPQITDCNAAAEQMLHGKKEQIIGLTPDQLSPKLQPNGRTSEEGVKENMEVILKQGGHRFEWMHTKITGEQLPCDVNISLIDYEERKVLLVSWRDITERKQAEAEREAFIERLTDSNEELERFAFVCSHDLQEPLRMIRSFTDRLQTYMGDTFEKDEKCKKYFRFITNGAEHAQNLINDILTYSSIDKDIQHLEKIDPEALILLMKENMYLDFEKRGGRITHDKLPKLVGNKTQLFQLFQNLINNGMKYQIPSNNPHVHIGVEDKESHWEFYVRDNGIGIEGRHLKKIFNVFQRLHKKSQYAGTGVGLSICKKVVERHGGKIWVESEKGKGSTFYFTLLKPTNMETADDQQSKAS